MSHPLPHTPLSAALTPTKLWHWFDVICSIPHASYHEQALSEHIVQWATNKGLETYTDSVGNIFISKNATEGYEDLPAIALQAHLDMVCQSNGDYDFLTCPITPVIDGDWVRADGTTLGADNGIGLASILAVLDSDDLAHPKIEAVLTMTEETGMDGAIGLERGRLSAKAMINTDTEEIDEIYIGCAGGVDADIHLHAEAAPLQGERVFEYRLSGLKGGHSGIDIHKNHANAIKLLAYALTQVGDIRLIALKGGTARNAIPRQATAQIATKDGQFLDKIERISQDIKALIGDFETKMAWQVKELDTNDTPKNALSVSDTQTIFNFINVLPNGVIRHSDKVADTVETSLSLGKARLEADGVHLTSMIRSLHDIGKATAVSAVQSVCDLAGAKAVFSGDYVGWSPNPDSAITQTTHKIYADVIGKEPALKVIHAGLECGLIQQAYPDMDIVSIGPTIKNAHSPDECVHIDSVTTYWQVLTQVLAHR